MWNLRAPALKTNCSGFILWHGTRIAILWITAQNVCQTLKNCWFYRDKLASEMQNKLRMLIKYQISFIMLDDILYFRIFIQALQRATSNCFMSAMSLMAKKQLNYCEDLIILGDMYCCPRKSDFIKTFCEMYGMKNLIVAPTCLKQRALYQLY